MRKIKWFNNNYITLFSLRTTILMMGTYEKLNVQHLKTAIYRFLPHKQNTFMQFMEHKSMKNKITCNNTSNLMWSESVFFSIYIHSWKIINWQIFYFRDLFYGNTQISVIATFHIGITDNKVVSVVCVLLNLTSNRARQSDLSSFFRALRSLLKEFEFAAVTKGPAHKSHQPIDTFTWFWHIGASYTLCLNVPAFLPALFHCWGCLCVHAVLWTSTIQA